MTFPAATDLNSFFLNVSAGLFPGWFRLSFEGRNPDLDTLTQPETLWQLGGQYVFQDSAKFLEVLSDNATDNGAGVGMRTLRIVGLDALFNLQTEVITLNGLTPVLSTKQYLRVNRVYGVSAGLSGSNVGTITVRVSPGGVGQGAIGPGEGLGLTGVQTVPQGYTLFIAMGFCTMMKAGATDSIALAIRVRAFTLLDRCWGDTMKWGLQSTGNSAAEILSVMPYAVPERADIELRCEECTSNNVAGSLLVQCILAENARIGLYPPYPQLGNFPPTDLPRLG